MTLRQRPFAQSAARRNRLAALAAPAGRIFDFWRGSGEQAVTISRLLLVSLVLVGASVQTCVGGRSAQEFFRVGMPWLQAYLALTVVLQAHIMLRPSPNVTRRLLAIGVDTAIISLGMHCGGVASAYLFPLYFWMILGNGLRFGGVFMVAAVVGAAAGFAATVASTPFWRANMAFSLGLFLALIVIPVYGGLLLRRLAEAHAEAERANHAKTLLLACVSHELRTPLTAIVGLAALLQETELDAEQLEMIRTVSGAGSLLLRHIEGLLTVSRDEIERGQAPPERVDLPALMISLRAMLAVEAEKKGLALGLCLEADTPRHIVAEPGLLVDVLHNLVGNAVKFTATGAVSIHAGVVRRDAECLDLRVEVRDTGIGLEKSAQKRIFESFVQADPDIARRYGGSGLGLAIARRRLEIRGGRIGVESEIGEGSCFWFELTVGTDSRQASAPATPSAESSDRKCNDGRAREVVQELAGHLFTWQTGSRGRPPFDGAQAGEPVCLVTKGSVDALAVARRFAYAALARDDDPGSRARGRDLAARMKVLAAGQGDAPPEDGRRRAPPREARKILLAEDNGVNLMVLDKILTRAGHATTVVTDGETALEAMFEGAFDVILLDVNLPGISGVEAARLYRLALPPQARAPIVALTADADMARREQCERAGMVCVLTKPITPEALLDAVAEACRTPAAAQRNQRAARKSREGKPWEGRPWEGRPWERNYRERNPAGRDGDSRSSPRPPDALSEVLDPAALAALAALGGGAFLRDVILKFLGEGAQIVERLTRALEIGDFDAFQHEAHALDSSAGNIGAAGLARLCRTWRGAEPARIALHGADFLDALRREWSRVGRALNAELARPARPDPDRPPLRDCPNPPRTSLPAS
ncbi:ATP-binding protein [uncultured Rhodoblastus sp.]|uniref:ATP-binding protein n=1 Tax=uncultured Rhodoblastus sp. TaxID=543037 RepID=UPI0025E49B41|nr:ATP-binding protein [uncultured Rhodoblastus sp.]